MLSQQRAILIRPFNDFKELTLCVDLQREIWGYSDLEVLPVQVFVVAQKVGGQILGAFDGDKVVGFALAFPATREGQTYLHSHMVGVVLDYRDRGVGRLLKLAQRDDALTRGIDLVEWTFDPLQLKNAHFNIAKLGAIARRYLPNLYGRTSSPLHGSLPTDRLIAEWRLNSEGVRDRLANKARVQSEVCERVVVPTAIWEICRIAPYEAESIQTEVRRQFDALISKGYAAIGFEFDQEKGTYVLERYEG